MRASTSCNRRWAVVLAGLLCVFWLGLVLDRWLAADAAAQNKPNKTKKKEEEEEGDTKKPARSNKAPKKGEEEEGPAKPDETRPIDLKAEAAQAEGKTKQLFTTLAIPHDHLVMPSGRLDPVEPLPEFLGRNPTFKGDLEVNRIEKSGKRTPLKYRTGEVKGFIPFEAIALKEVNSYLTDKDLPHLVAAEKALIFALRFHSTGRQKRAEDAKKWAALEEKLRDKLLQVRLAEIPALASEAQTNKARWKDAFGMAEQLVKKYPESNDVQMALVTLTYQRALDTDRVDDYIAARRALVAFEGLFPAADRTESIRKGLMARAKRMAERAERLAEKDKERAVRILRQAAQIWPQPNLQDKLRTLDNEHPVLYVGVKSLPKYLSPATAWTDAERQAVELLFEGLVEPYFDAGGVWRYHPALAEGRPRVTFLGREFQLAHDAFWSDGKRVTATDVRHTVGLLKKADLAGRNTAWADLVEDPRVEGTPYQIRITLKNGFLDPLSLMTFKVLPRQVRNRVLPQADDEDFGLNPVGSGPYHVRGPATVEGYNYLVFAANPFYQRASKPGRPRISEIRFFVPKEPVREFRDGRLHLLLDLPTPRLRELKQLGLPEQSLLTLGNRRVYFLAVNHQNEALQNQHLRKAIAHAIDRDALLTSHFRGGYKGVDRDGRLMEQLGADSRPLHPELNGPYPPMTWACAPSSRVPARLYNLDLARSDAKRALAKLSKVNLTLKYPDDDPLVQKACQEICDQVGKLNGEIKITPVAVAPRDFRKAIFKRDYELAYCHYDYTSEAYWLWPLFDPSENARSPGGSNYLRYQNDDVLESYFRRAMNHCNFNEVRKLTQDIHAHLYEKMPLIPLWQLHTHLAVHSSLQTVDLDPLQIFTSAEDWKLEKK
jgi:peptide/nickel transport system substrate-binding protein